MFYIEKYAKFNKKDFTLMHIGPTLIVFLAFAGITLWSSIDIMRTVERDKQLILSRNMASTEAAVKDRMATYEDVLGAGTGLFDASDKVTRSEWKDFIAKFELENRYPGVQGIGFIEVITAQNLGGHIESVKAEGYPDYQIFPQGEREIYTSLVYIEPLTSKNKQALGFDMYSEKNRRAAMEGASSTGGTAITDTVTLIQNQASSENPQSLIMFKPVYTKGSDGRLATPDQRNANLEGYIYAQLDIGVLLEGLSSRDNANFDYKITSKSNSEETSVFQGPEFESITNSPESEALTNTFKMNNKQWILTGTVSEEVISARDRNRPTTTLWGGLLFSAFLAGFIYLLLLNRTRALKNQEEKEIQFAKDELLALASHQLRTPATGVKQYIGMLKEGYGGKITAQQKRLIEKAYESNERQLGTINDMLFVAKADSGHLELTIERINLTSLVTDIIDEQLDLIKDKKHKLLRHFPKKPIYIKGDTKYLRMAIENLVNNAIKYTPQKGKIEIGIKRRKASVELSVADTGIGISEKDFTMLFKKFSRIPNTMTTQVSGTGIGLYLAQKIMKAHEGKIKFTSVEDEGSTFSLVFPNKSGSKPNL